MARYSNSLMEHQESVIKRMIKVTGHPLVSLMLDTDSIQFMEKVEDILRDFNFIDRNYKVTNIFFRDSEQPYILISCDGIYNFKSISVTSKENDINDVEVVLDEASLSEILDACDKFIVSRHKKMDEYSKYPPVDEMFGKFLEVVNKYLDPNEYVAVIEKNHLDEETGKTYPCIVINSARDNTIYAGMISFKNDPYCGYKLCSNDPFYGESVWTFTIDEESMDKAISCAITAILY